ncbi:response regulator transcription factor [Nocardioides daejeonensis]|uniref:response regulator n=1 Tax=Nocardioides daejeonensis TaxID=1046556 RepID=UPI000D74E9A8|nr:response regulator transcription factor [Nocardioides daejeonensis]
MSIRVVVVDDHPVFLIGMAALLDSLAGIEVVGRASDGDGAVAVVEEHRPDVVLMDLDLTAGGAAADPDGAGAGIEATRRITTSMPDTAVLVVTMLGDDDSLFAAIRAGARGYLLKGAAAPEVERAVRAVANGEMLLGPEVARRAATYLSGARTRGASVFPELTGREREVLELVALGYDNSTIARRLVLSSKTVRNYVYGIITKLHARDRSDLIVRAREAGLGEGGGG